MIYPQRAQDTLIMSLLRQNDVVLASRTRWFMSYDEVSKPVREVPENQN